MPSAAIRRLCDFVDASPTAFHAADSIIAALGARGARRLDERAAWELEPGATYFLERNGSAVIAFRPGLGDPAAEGFALAAAHTDSPALKARIDKPLAGKGLERVAVEAYGGPIVSTWLDRPLSLAGRVALRRGRASAGGEDGVELRLVNLARPAAVVPNLAIHINREVNKGFEYNAQTHLPALVAATGPGADPGQETAGEGRAWALRLVARELGVEPDAVLGSDLFFVDAQKTCLFGEREELVNGYRLDDLLGCHAILEAFLNSGPGPRGQVAFFPDNEEVGSRTIQGADSSFLRDALGRICALMGCGTQDFYRALASSFCVSVDAAQAWHPSYPEKFDESFTPLLNGGPAVKVNGAFKYATDASAEARFRLLCSEAGVPCQKLMMRSDLPSGSTIGPLGSSLTGIPTVDVGSPLLSMHSIRETAGASDHEAMIAVLGRHFRGTGAS